MRLNAATASAKRRRRGSARRRACSSASTRAYCAGVGQHRDVLPVLRRRAHHRRAADVDVLDRVFERAAGLGDGGLERVEVDDQQVDRADAVLLPAPPCARATSRRASRPPWIVGCSVFTRPSSISGKPVSSATSVTGRPASASSLAVPPVDSSFTPSACSARANSTMPVLSETEMQAQWSWCRNSMRRAPLDQLVFEQLAPQRVAVDAQPLGRLATGCRRRASSPRRAAASRPRASPSRASRAARRRAGP